MKQARKPGNRRVEFREEWGERAGRGVDGCYERMEFEEREGGQGVLGVVEPNQGRKLCIRLWALVYELCFSFFAIRQSRLKHVIPLIISREGISP